MQQEEDSIVPQGEITKKPLQGETLKTYHCRDPTTNTQVKITDTLSIRSSFPEPDYSTPYGQVSPSNLPIALQKATKTRTQHSISHVVSYDSLSSSYDTIVSSLSSVSIPQIWQEAFVNKKWKLAMVEEMHALKKNGTSSWETTCRMQMGVCSQTENGQYFEQI